MSIRAIMLHIVYDKTLGTCTRVSTDDTNYHPTYTIFLTRISNCYATILYNSVHVSRTTTTNRTILSETPFLFLFSIYRRVHTTVSR